MRQKRFFALIIAALLMLANLPAVAASASVGVYFTMINNNDPEALEASTMPYSSNGIIYAPLSTLGKLGIVYMRYDSGIRLSLSRDSSVYVDFNLENDTNVSSQGGSLGATPLYRYGSYFFPVSSTSSGASTLMSYFGVAYQLIQCQPAPIVWLSNESASTLSYESVYQNADTDYGLTEKYNAYVGLQNDLGESGSATVGAASNGTKNNGSTENNGDITGGNDLTNDSATSEQDEHDETDDTASAREISVSFVGLTDETDALLNALESGDITASFFLSAENIKSYPDIVRRIHGEGHQIGIYLEQNAEEEYQSATAALFDAVKLRTMLVATENEAVTADAEALGLILCGDQIIRQLSIQTDNRQWTSLLMVDCYSVSVNALTELVQVLGGRSYRVVKLSEFLF